MSYIKFATPPQLVDVDPRALYASQWGVVRHHAAYYLTGTWERTGRTSADAYQRSNQYPLIAVDERGRLVIRAGHHRSLAALIEGRLLRCRLHTPQIEVGDAIAVTPSLLVGTDTPLTHLRVSDPAAAADSIEQGHVALLPSIDAAAATLALLGFTNTEIAFRLRLATPPAKPKGTR